MRLEKAHRILIASFVAFALFFAAFKLRLWQQGGAGSDLWIALAAVAVAAGFGLYLRSLPKAPPP